MVNFIHSQSPPDQNHPARGVTFTGDVSAYRPTQIGILLIKDDETPKLLYFTTGLLPGDLELVGSLYETFSGNPFAITPRSPNALFLKTDGHNPSLWMSTGTNPGNMIHVAGAVIGGIASPHDNIYPDVPFQLYISTSEQFLYYSNAYGSRSWTALDGLGGAGGGGGSGT